MRPVVHLAMRRNMQLEVGCTLSPEDPTCENIITNNIDEELHILSAVLLWRGILYRL
jgi:hypothetical protein